MAQSLLDYFLNNAQDTIKYSFDYFKRNFYRIVGGKIKKDIYDITINELNRYTPTGKNPKAARRRTSEGIENINNIVVNFNMDNSNYELTFYNSTRPQPPLATPPEDWDLDEELLTELLSGYKDGEFVGARVPNIFNYNPFKKSYKTPKDYIWAIPNHMNYEQLYEQYRESGKVDEYIEEALEKVLKENLINLVKNYKK